MKTIKQYPTQLELKSLFRYCETGNLYWKTQKQGRLKDRPVGFKNADGYIQVTIDGERYQLHRLIYILHHGDIPNGYVVDHISGESNNNRVENLQPITNHQNITKKKMSKYNKSGFRGVSWDSKKNKWRVQIYLNKKRIHVGYFNELEEAALSYDNAAIKYHGEFAQLNFTD